jgi:hypothetical protein
MTVLTMIGNREVSSRELPDFEDYAFQRRVKLKEAIVKNEMAMTMAALKGKYTGEITFVLVFQSKMNNKHKTVSV